MGLRTAGAYCSLRVFEFSILWSNTSTIHLVQCSVICDLFVMLYVSNRSIIKTRTLIMTAMTVAVMIPVCDYRVSLYGDYIHIYNYMKYNYDADDHPSDDTGV